MSSAEQDALKKATKADGSIDEAIYQKEYKKGLGERQDRAVHDSHDVWRAMDGWSQVEGPEQWNAIVRQMVGELSSGYFFVNRMGGQKYLDPQMMAILKIFHDGLIEEYGADSATDKMLIGMALIQFHRVITTNEWIGNVIASAQTELFGPASLTSKLEDQYGRGSEFRGLRVEEFIRRLSEQLTPLVDKANNLLLRNLKALIDRKLARAQAAIADGSDELLQNTELAEDADTDQPVPSPLSLRRAGRARSTKSRRAVGDG